MSLLSQILRLTFSAILLISVAGTVADAATATVEWDPNTESDLAGYRVYYGSEPGNHSTTVEVGLETRVIVPNLADATTYYFSVTAFNTAGLESAPSEEVAFTTGSSVNTAPTVNVVSPVDGTGLNAPASVLLEAVATDSDGTVARVEFFHGVTKLGEDLSSPYALPWANLTAGSYTITAVAHDNAGGSATSAPISFTVAAPNVAPTVTLTAPTAGVVFASPASITLTANAADADGSVIAVRFYSGATLLGESRAAPFAFTWNNVNEGTYQLAAVAFDDLGASSMSGPVSVMVAPANQSPAVSFTSPAEGAIYHAPGTITLAAAASDADGAVVAVRFFQGSNLLAEDTTAPFSYAWNDAAPGSYSLTAVAVDNGGKTSTTGPMTIVVNARPTIALSAEGSYWHAPATVDLTATASDSDGIIAKVEFFHGASKLGETAASPYHFAWTPVDEGTYTIRAVATDNRGGTAISQDLKVVVNPPNRLPAVTLAAPEDGTLFHAPAVVALKATASDPDGAIVRVEFLAGETLVGSSTTSPYGVTWSNVPSGNYSLTAVAFDNLGGSTRSAPVAIHVNAPPKVSVSLNKSKLPIGYLTVNGTASDPDGVVTRVEFYCGEILLLKDSASPYRVQWNNIRPGTYEITAVAYDDLGAVTTSAPVSITVPAKSTQEGSAIEEPVLPAVLPLGGSQSEGFALRIQGVVGDIYDVWYSEDLKEWFPLISILNAEGEVMVDDAYAPPGGNRFYRVSIHP